MRASKPPFGLGYCMKGKKWLLSLYYMVYVYYKYVCIIINEYCKIGNDVTIFQGVTIGGSRGKGVPMIGDNVVLAVGAIVIGNVNIGDNVFVGAGTVVTKDVADGAVVVGNPARVINHIGAEKVAYYNQRY